MKKITFNCKYYKSKLNTIEKVRYTFHDNEIVITKTVKKSSKFKQYNLDVSFNLDPFKNYTLGTLSKHLGLLLIFDDSVNLSIDNINIYTLSKAEKCNHPIFDYVALHRPQLLAAQKALNNILKIIEYSDFDVVLETNLDDLVKQSFNIELLYSNLFKTNEKPFFKIGLYDLNHCFNESEIISYANQIKLSGYSILYVLDLCVVNEGTLDKTILNVESIKLIDVQLLPTLNIDDTIIEERYADGKKYIIDDTNYMRALPLLLE